MLEMFILGRAVVSYDAVEDEGPLWIPLLEGAHCSSGIAAGNVKDEEKETEERDTVILLDHDRHEVSRPSLLGKESRHKIVNESSADLEEEALVGGYDILKYSSSSPYAARIVVAIADLHPLLPYFWCRNHSMAMHNAVQPTKHGTSTSRWQETEEKGAITGYEKLAAEAVPRGRSLEPRRSALQSGPPSSA